MKAYIEFAKKSFVNNLAFRSNYFFGLLSTIILIFVNVSIWRALYGGQAEINGISFPMVVTNFVIGLSISNALNVDDFMISNKVRDGQIAMDLLKPLNLNLTMMAGTLGNNLFRLIANFTPSLLIALIFFRILPPVSGQILLYTVLAVMLGFLILYNISYIVSVLSFWFVNVWSLATIKNVFLGVLTGTMLPLWFMPDWVNRIIKYTPFDVIHFAPVKIYLGQMTMDDILAVYAKQAIWIVVLFVAGRVLWTKGIKKLIVVGG
jgi:ABC-2 type transport system permease protein